MLKIILIFILVAQADSQINRRCLEQPRTDRNCTRPVYKWVYDQFQSRCQQLLVCGTIRGNGFITVNACERACSRNSVQNNFQGRRAAPVGPVPPPLRDRGQLRRAPAVRDQGQEGATRSPAACGIGRPCPACFRCFRRQCVRDDTERRCRQRLASAVTQELQCGPGKLCEQCFVCQSGRCLLDLNEIRCRKSNATIFTWTPCKSCKPGQCVSDDNLKNCYKRQNSSDSIDCGIDAPCKPCSVCQWGICVPDKTEPRCPDSPNKIENTNQVADIANKDKDVPASPILCGLGNPCEPCNRCQRGVCVEDQEEFRCRIRNSECGIARPCAACFRCVNGKCARDDSDPDCGEDNPVVPGISRVPPGPPAIVPPSAASPARVNDQQNKPPVSSIDKRCGSNEDCDPCFTCFDGFCLRNDNEQRCTDLGILGVAIPPSVPLNRLSCGIGNRCPPCYRCLRGQCFADQSERRCRQQQRSLQQPATEFRSLTAAPSTSPVREQSSSCGLGRPCAPCFRCTRGECIADQTERRCIAQLRQNDTLTCGLLRRSCPACFRCVRRVCIYDDSEARCLSVLANQAQDSIGECGPGRPLCEKCKTCHENVCVNDPFEPRCKPPTSENEAVRKINAQESLCNTTSDCGLCQLCVQGSCVTDPGCSKPSVEGKKCSASKPCERCFVCKNGKCFPDTNDRCRRRPPNFEVVLFNNECSSANPCSQCFDCINGRCVRSNSPICQAIEHPCKNRTCPECQECRANRRREARCVRDPACCLNDEATVNCVVNPCKETRRICKKALSSCVPIFCSGCERVFYDSNLNEISEEDC